MNPNSLNSTPSANRIHIGFFGRRNSGKSSLLNAFTGQEVAIVSAQAGTTTDPVSKAMEVKGLGPTLLIDTAGFDDEGQLGAQRVQKTEAMAQRVDVALILVAAPRLVPFKAQDLDLERQWAAKFAAQKTPVLWVISQSDSVEPEPLRENLAAFKEELGGAPLPVSLVDPQSIAALRQRVAQLNLGGQEASILGDLVSSGDCVLLVMPQDIQAPQGRLILPQVQTIRELLDRRCLVMATTFDQLPQSLKALAAPPQLIVTDSQVFDKVYKLKPAASRLTSFSVLFANYKGDLAYYLAGAEELERLTPQARILIAECCTHVPLQEDIGRVQLPRLLRQRLGEGIRLETVSGADFPEDLRPYDLIIQCGGCIFNRQHVLSRLERARQQGVPMSNYGVIIAKLKGILPFIALPH